MAPNHDLPATDSAAVLHELVGDDATAAFENDPTFIDGNPGATSSSENLQTRSDRRDIQSQPDLETRRSAADDEDEDEDVDDEDEDDEDYDEDDEDDEEEDDLDEDDEDDDEEDDDDEYEDVDDDEDDDDEDEE